MSLWIMSFLGEIMDLYAEGAAGMTACINDKNGSCSYSQPLWECQVISFASWCKASQLHNVKRNPFTMWTHCNYNHNKIIRKLNSPTAIMMSHFGHYAVSSGRKGTCARLWKVRVKVFTMKSHNMLKCCRGWAFKTHYIWADCTTRIYSASDRLIINSYTTQGFICLLSDHGW